MPVPSTIHYSRIQNVQELSRGSEHIIVIEPSTSTRRADVHLHRAPTSVYIARRRLSTCRADMRLAAHLPRRIFFIVSRHRLLLSLVVCCLCSTVAAHLLCLSLDYVIVPSTRAPTPIRSRADAYLLVAPTSIYVVRRRSIGPTTAYHAHTDTEIGSHQTIVFDHML